MKIVSIILIVAYLMLPTICFGHPCEQLSMDAPQSAVTSDASGECPLPHDTDDCETTCCCAGHVPLFTSSKIIYTGLITKQLPYQPHLALPRLIDRIFVPPQNLS